MEVKNKQLSRAAVLISRPTILKAPLPAGSAFKKIYRWILGGSLPFQNERAFYLANAERFRGVESFEFANILMIQYQEPEGVVSKFDITPSVAAEIFEQIASYRAHNTFGPIKQVMFRALNGPMQRTLRDITSSNYFSLSEKARLALAVVQLHVRNQKKPKIPTFIHNDLILHNLIRIDGELIPIDFEDSLQESTWFFVDLTDLLFQRQEWTKEEVLQVILDTGLLKESKMPPGSERAHFDFGFLRYHIRATVMSRRKSCEKKRAASLVREWLNDK